MSFFVYMLQCADDSFYIGHTDNLEARIGHHIGGTFKGYTHKRRPVELVWSETFQTRDQAFEAERKLKGWSRAKKQALVYGDWAEIKRLARNHQNNDGDHPSTRSG